MEEENQADGVSIHTGFPNPAADKSLHGLDINRLLIKHPTSTYLFRVEGNDWQAQGIFDNDIAVIDRGVDPRKNDVVLWWDDVHGQFAISRWHAMPDEAACWGVITATIHQLTR